MIQPPTFFYGTAWKEERTAELTFQALVAGFKAIDTANQRKHYNESGVGEGLQRFLRTEGQSRGNLFLQTKFTYARGQDHRKPYNETDPLYKQVEQSFESSLKHLGIDYLDSYILHGPFSDAVLNPEDLEVWEAMERLAESGKVRFLGVSNVYPAQLAALYENARIKPAFAQIRCYASRRWDKETREFCDRHGIRFQGFSLLTANRVELSSEQIASIAKKYGKTVPQVVFKFCQSLGMISLTGTTDVSHMKQDLQIEDFSLTSDELLIIENISEIAGI